MDVYLVNMAGVDAHMRAESFSVVGPHAVEIDGAVYDDIECYRLDDEPWVTVEEVSK